MIKRVITDNSDKENNTQISNKQNPIKEENILTISNTDNSNEEKNSLTFNNMNQIIEENISIIGITDNLDEENNSPTFNNHNPIKDDDTSTTTFDASPIKDNSQENSVKLLYENLLKTYSFEKIVKEVVLLCQKKEDELSLKDEPKTLADEIEKIYRKFGVIKMFRGLFIINNDIIKNSKINEDKKIIKSKIYKILLKSKRKKNSQK